MTIPTLPVEECKTCGSKRATFNRESGKSHEPSQIEPPELLNGRAAQRFGCGDKTWPNLESLIYDAHSVDFHRKEASKLHDLIGAIAAGGSIRVGQAALEARLSYRIAFDPASKEYIIGAK